ncbi:MAG: FAD-dependent oxidoreductase, partial [Streptosporangiales bacterium]|nr:FAD-dependent oxidoreductase [Streptosporangiales bacterium]
MPAPPPIAFQRAVFDAIDEVLAIMTEHGHDVNAVKGGYLTVARTTAEVGRLREALAADRDWGLTEDDVRLLGADETRARVAVDGVLGATYSPHCARLDPARLVTALAAIVEAAGVDIYESTAALAIHPRRVVTERGVVRADVVLRATEGYTPSLPGGARELLPMLSSMIATEPLPAAQWERIGWGGREALS